MNCVYYNNFCPTTFEEYQDFGEQLPYSIQVKHFEKEDIVPFHYGHTMEILICDHLKGEVTIDGQSYTLGGKQVFVIPPYTIHSNRICQCDGTEYVVKVSLSDIEPYLSLTNLASAIGCDIGKLAYICPEYQEIHRIITGLIEKDGQMLYCIGSIAMLFHILCKYVDNTRDMSASEANASKSELRKIIKWTQLHHREKITLVDVANLTGYSKFYFCNWFKAATGSTYFNFLNQVRLENACRLLRNGASISEVAYECGFCNNSYFIQTFKKAHGVTPKQYVQTLSIQHN